MSAMARLLVLEDDDGIRASLSLALEDEGFDVVQSADAEGALAAVREHGVDLMLVDIMLGGLDGFTFIRLVRPLSQAPIIVLSARGGTTDIVEALEAGADDYVTKPFVVTEVIARLRALLRRPTARPRAPAPESSARELAARELAAGGVAMGGVATGGPVANGSDPNPEVSLLDGEHGPLVLDQGAGSVRRGDESVHLTVTEYRLLVELASPSGRVLSRRTLLERVWDRGFFGDERIVDVHVRRLRTKIEQDPSAPRLVVTVRGLGYRLDPR
jgi:DNA-binding response OmpR family regulator